MTYAIHTLTNSSPSTGAAPAFEPIATAPFTPRADAVDAEVIELAGRVERLSRRCDAAADRRAKIEDRVMVEGPRRPVPPAPPPTRHTVLDQHTATERVVTLTSPLDPDPALIEWERVREASEEEHKRKVADLEARLGLPDLGKRLDRMFCRLERWAIQLTVMGPKTPAGLAAKAAASVAIMETDSSNAWVTDLSLAVGRDTVRLNPPTGPAPGDDLYGPESLGMSERRELSPNDIDVIDTAKLLISYCGKNVGARLYTSEVGATGSCLTTKTPASLIALGVKGDAYLWALGNAGADAKWVQRLGVAVAQDARNLALRSVLPEPDITMAEAASLEFTPRDMEGWRPHTNVEWADLADPYLMTVRVAYTILQKTKAELVDIVAAFSDDAAAEDLLKSLEQAEAFFGMYHELVDTARTRYLVAAATVAHQRHPADEAKAARVA